MSDVINEEERHEAATEEPTTVGCPSLGLKKLPGGFDGVEPESASRGGRDGTELASAGRGGRDGTEKLGKLEKRIAKTPQTIVFETISPSGLKLSAEWEAEETCHGAQAFLYKDDKCVCQIRFFNTFQTRNVGSHITRGALYALTSLCGHAKRWRENKKAGGAK